MKEVYLKKLLSILKTKSEDLSQTISIINKDDIINNEKIANEIHELNNLNAAIDSIKPFLQNKANNSLNDEIQLCANLLIVFESECDKLLHLEKKVKKYTDTILTIGGAKLDSVEYKEIANSLDILQKNYDNFKKELLIEYDLLENLFKEICKGTSHFNSFLNKLNSCAKKVFIFEEI